MKRADDVDALHLRGDGPRTECGRAVRSSVSVRDFPANSAHVEALCAECAQVRDPERANRLREDLPGLCPEHGPQPMGPGFCCPKMVREGRPGAVTRARRHLLAQELRSTLERALQVLDVADVRRVLAEVLESLEVAPPA